MPAPRTAGHRLVEQAAPARRDRLFLESASSRALEVLRTGRGASALRQKRGWCAPDRRRCSILSTVGAEFGPRSWRERGRPSAAQRPTFSVVTLDDGETCERRGRSLGHRPMSRRKLGFGQCRPLLNGRTTEVFHMARPAITGAYVRHIPRPVPSRAARTPRCHVAATCERASGSPVLAFDEAGSASIIPSGWETIASPEVFIARQPAPRATSGWARASPGLPYHHPLMWRTASCSWRSHVGGRTIWAAARSALPSDPT